MARRAATRRRKTRTTRRRKVTTRRVRRTTTKKRRVRRTVRKTRKRKSTRTTRRRRSTKAKRGGHKFKSPIAYRLREIPIKQIAVWRDAQARRLDREGIAELAKSIKNDGLQNPPMVQKEGRGKYLLMSGQRRLAALKRLRAKKIPVLVLSKQTAYDLGDAKAASVVENLHRRGMKSRDLAKACAFLAERMTKAKAAAMIGISMPTFKKLHGYAGVPDALKSLTPKTISRDDATTLYRVAPSVAKAVSVAEKISKFDAPTRKRYIAAFGRSPRSSHKTLLKRARVTKAKQKVRVQLSKSAAKKLAAKSKRKELTPEEFASNLVSKWLRSH